MASAGGSYRVSNPCGPEGYRISVTACPVESTHPIRKDSIFLRIRMQVTKDSANLKYLSGGDP